MTASEIMPIFVSTTQLLVSYLADFEVFDNISFLAAAIGLSAVSIIIAFILWIMGITPGLDKSQGDEWKEPDRYSTYRKRFGRGRR